jgi:hypothetical protein
MNKGNPKERMEKPMNFLTRLLGLLLTGLMVTACSGGTKMDSSWSSDSHKSPIKKVYIIGVAKSELNRMIFEDTFENRLTNKGVEAFSSYKDLLPINQVVDREDIIQRMRNNNCDSILLTRLVRKRTKASISGGQGTYTNTPGSYSSGVTYHKRPRDSYYSSWGKYYSYSSRSIYVPPASLDRVILTVESVLYDLQTEELIWSAQLETALEGNIENMMQKFVGEVIKDLTAKGFI